jgi:preprotein translocase subunit YajC
MDPLLIVMVAVLALFIFMQVRSSKKRRAEQEQLQTKMVPGAQIMTQFGLFGTLLSVNEESNEALIETTPGTVVRVHRQTLLKVVEDETPQSPADDERQSIADDDAPTNPENNGRDSL